MIRLSVYCKLSAGQLSRLSHDALPTGKKRSPAAENASAAATNDAGFCSEQRELFGKGLNLVGDWISFDNAYFSKTFQQK